MRTKTAATTVLVFVSGLALAACGGSGVHTAAPRTRVYRWGVVGSAGKIATLELATPTVVAGISGSVVQIATSNSDGYALTASGQVFAWGVDNFGELGDGRTEPYTTRAVRVDFPASIRIVSLPDPMPFDGALAIDSHQHVWGWGLDASGDLCLTGPRLLRPRRIALGDVTLASGARTHSLFYSHHHVYACGSGDAGELGTGSTKNATTPTPVVGLPVSVPVVELTSSWEGSGALLRDGRYYDWGYDAAGQLGNASTTDSDVPVAVDLPSPVRQVFQGGSGATNGQTVAILADRSVWAWGNNDRGQLGDGDRADADVPVRVTVPAGVTFRTVSSGGYSSYAIDTRGRLWAWGGDQNGQIGTGHAAGVETLPVELPLHLTQVSSTASNVAGLAGN